MPKLEGKETRYFVIFTVAREGYSQEPRKSNVSLREGYSDFESIRKIISIRQGVKVEEIIVQACAILPE